MTPHGSVDTLSSYRSTTKERSMMMITPEYVQAHISNLTSSAASGEIARHRLEAVARLRRERRARLNRLASSVYRSLPFVNRAVEAELAPTKAPQTA
jgi:hypothetical protein